MEVRLMFIARRVAFLLVCMVVWEAAWATEPDGYWILDTIDAETPAGGLKLNQPQSFSLLLFDSNCELYQAKGKVKKKEHAWQLKNQADHSNVFMLTQEPPKLKLVDTEGQTLLFIPASKSGLDASLKKAKEQSCRQLLPEKSQK